MFNFKFFAAPVALAMGLIVCLPRIAQADSETTAGAANDASAGNNGSRTFFSATRCPVTPTARFSSASCGVRLPAPSTERSANEQR